MICNLNGKSMRCFAIMYNVKKEQLEKKKKKKNKTAKDFNSLGNKT